MPILHDHHESSIIGYWENKQMKGKTATVNKVQSPKLKVIRPSGTGFGYCINCYNGCEHGCQYCYSRKIAHKDEATWINAQPRLQIVDLLKKDVKNLKSSNIVIRDMFLCSICDAYQPIELQYGITRRVIEILIGEGLPFTVLTKNTNVLRDLDLFKGYEKCRVGLTVITLDDNFRKKLEPNASPIADRCDALETLKANGVSTYCSVEPIMPCKESDPIEIVKRLRNCVDLFEFGKWSPYIMKGIPVTYNEDYYVGLFGRLIPYCEQEGIKYCTASHSETFLKSKGFKFIPYQLVSDRPYPNPNDLHAKTR